MSIAAKGCVHSKRWQSIELRDQRLICENWIWLACQASPLGNLGFVSNLFNVHLNLQKHNVFLTTGLHISCIPLTGFNLPFPHRPGWIVDFEGQNGDSDPRRTGQYWAFMAITLRSPQGPWYKIALEAPLHRLVGIHTLASKIVTSQAEVQHRSKAKRRHVRWATVYSTPLPKTSKTSWCLYQNCFKSWASDASEFPAQPFHFGHWALYLFWQQIVAHAAGQKLDSLADQGLSSPFLSGTQHARQNIDVSYPPGDHWKGWPGGYPSKLSLQEMDSKRI